MGTSDQGPAQQYHTETSYARERMHGHVLDWANQPLPYKDYPDAPSKPLPTDIRLAQASPGEMPPSNHGIEPDTPFDLRRLAVVCALTHSFTAKRRIQGQTYFYRSVASAGALYPAELYLAADQISGLASGLYYYDIRTFALKQLRSDLNTPAGPHHTPSPKRRPALATFFITGIFFRSAWKYRARALRYVLLDAGHLLENLRKALHAQGLKFQVDYDFDDGVLNRYLMLDPRREALFCTVTVYGETAPQTSEGPQTGPRPHALVSGLSATDQPADNEIIYESIENMYRASIPLPQYPLPRNADLQVTQSRPTKWLPLPPYDQTADERTYDQAVVQRRSKRNFIDRPLPRVKACNLLRLLGNASLPDKTSAGLQIGIATRGVTGLAAGFYLLDHEKSQVGLVRAAQLVQPMATVCLDQQWLKNAALHLLFMVNLKALDRTWGARGYRYAMLEAGRLGQTLYLGATTLGLGCCGIGAFYDDEARSLLALNADSVLLYLVAVGQVRRLFD
jgi:SagB-type dehydrogenase family enzyme